VAYRLDVAGHQTHVCPLAVFFALLIVLGLSGVMTKSLVDYQQKNVTHPLANWQ
jgi:hypothetical protein